ncbi:DUF6463 family protein [Rhizobacter sp. J219]|uniref:DUF6463 family protein n=1 Tax=Rhizobacter sp. J219 TaxID=2898430 RepID=UPI00215125DB|nr:DUF6463 family protein [Rhizobacter sp. J219]MCR5883821.1 DUF6463 family protein [Rhizobacter sp. J219]
MPKFSAWALLVLGIIHIVFGVLRFKEPLLGALSGGFFGQFAEPELRRTAFWFLMCGVTLVLAGHLAIRAVAAGDLKALRVMGTYLLASSVVGIAAFPRSPLWMALVLSLLLLASSVRWSSGRQ